MITGMKMYLAAKGAGFSHDLRITKHVPLNEGNDLCVVSEAGGFATISRGARSEATTPPVGYEELNRP